MTLRPVDDMLLRALSAEPRPAMRGEGQAAGRMIAADLIEAAPRTHGSRGRILRLTPAGRAMVAKLPKPRTLMLLGSGPRWDCVHDRTCLTGFVEAYPSAEEAHCPPQCAHRQDVERHASGFGSSSLAQMQDYSEGWI